jgi:hypothetical protein
MAPRGALGDPGAMVGMRKVIAWLVIAVLVVALVVTLALEAVAA